VAIPSTKCNGFISQKCQQQNPSNETLVYKYLYHVHIWILCTLNLEMLEHVHKYLGDFCDFISLVIMYGIQKYQTFEGFCEAL
jgi:hypothetical protein